MRVQVAHVRLCASRGGYVRAYPRATQEMVFDAHASGFAFFGDVPARGIYDNMKTAVTMVTTVFTGKERLFNRAALIAVDHRRAQRIGGAGGGIIHRCRGLTGNEIEQRAGG